MSKLTKGHRFYPETDVQKLALLVEECGEVLAAAGKSQRWGLDSYNPLSVDKESNAEWLLRELEDLEQAIKIIRPVLRRVVKAPRPGCERRPRSTTPSSRRRAARGAAPARVSPLAGG